MIQNKEPLAFSKLFAGSSQTVLIILVIIIGVGYIINGDVPDGLIEFAKWVVGGTSATGVAYMLKSGVENKAKIEKDAEFKTDAELYGGDFPFEEGPLPMDETINYDESGFSYDDSGSNAEGRYDL